MRTITHVVGARPNFMKAAPVIAGLESRGAAQRIVHTGQHYSDTLSEVFFRELGIPAPDVNLGVGSGSHGEQTAAILVALERELLANRPDVLLLYGDVNSTIAGALVAAKLGVVVGHVEAGLRSFDRSMPEEINRVVTDALSDVLFATSPDAVDHLVAAGVDRRRIHFVGNPMIDTLLAHRDRFDAQAIRGRFGLDDRYAVVTLHRPANVDDPDAARRFVGALASLASVVRIVLPLHPRGRSVLLAVGLGDVPNLDVIEPLGYVDFLSLVSGSAFVATDSGGIQEETTILGIPCLTLRPNTERPITISHGTNRLVTPETLVDAATSVLEEPRLVLPPPPLWDGLAGSRIAEALMTMEIEADGRLAGAAT